LYILFYSSKISFFNFSKKEPRFTLSS